MARSVVLAVGVLLLLGAGSWELGADRPAARTASTPGGRIGQVVEPSIRTELDTGEITVGDPLSLTVTVEHDVGSSVVWPDSIDLGSFELLDAMLLDPVRDGDRVESTARFDLTAFELGDLEIPSFDVTVLGADSSAVKLSTDGWTVTVASVGLDDSGDIRDIKGPLGMSRNWLLLVPWLLAVGAVGAIGYWIYRKYRSSRQVAPEWKPTAPARPPHELAYESLDRLEASGLLEKGEIKAYHIEVSEIMRRYIEGRYRVDALEMATYEVIQGLERVGLAFDARVQFDRFLGDCDMVKFAKLRPAIEACRGMIPRARKLVDGTRELEVIAETEDGEGHEVPATSAAAASLPQGRGEGAEA